MRVTEQRKFIKWDKYKMQADLTHEFGYILVYSFKRIYFFRSISLCNWLKREEDYLITFVCDYQQALYYYKPMCLPLKHVLLIAYFSMITEKVGLLQDRNKKILYLYADLVPTSQPLFRGIGWSNTVSATKSLCFEICFIQKFGVMGVVIK